MHQEWYSLSHKDFEERWSKIAILVTPPISQQTILSNHKRLLYATRRTNKGSKHKENNDMYSWIYTIVSFEANRQDANAAT